MKKIIIGLIFVPFILSASIKTGSEAPDFELMDSYGNKVKELFLTQSISSKVSKKILLRSDECFILHVLVDDVFIKASP